jgi:hypothetical protein
MCLVIDTCCLSSVFEADAKRHAKFVPVLEWITEGRGRMIYGGTKYNTELRKISKVLGIVSELSKQRRTIQLPNATVDPIAAALKEKCPEAKFDDEHIVALVIASRCRVVCTDDNDAISYLKRNDLFTDYAGAARPSVYRGHKDHKKLCGPQFIVGMCREQA